MGLKLILEEHQIGRVLPQTIALLHKPSWSYLDYAKAFDKVDLKLHISKLKRYGFHEKLIRWIESFLSDREQVVVLNGVHSDSAKVLSGVHQAK